MNFSKKKSLEHFIFIFAIIFFSIPAFAADHGEYAVLQLQAPAKAVISPSSARLSVTQEVSALEKNGSNIVEFLLPEDASNLQLHIPGQTVIRYTTEPVILADTKPVANQRERILQTSIQLKAQLETIKARIDVWTSQTNAASAEELQQRQQLMQQELPQLAATKTNLERRISLIEKELRIIPETGMLGQKIIVTLAQNSSPNEKIVINYNYDLASCGWQPVYNFNAIVKGGQEEKIAVSLLGEVWQYSGIDWEKTEIVLATQGIGNREPAPLAKWIVGKQEPAPQPRSYTLNGVHKNNILAETAAATMDAAIPVAASVSKDTESIYANWTLSAKGLPEGKSRVLLTMDEWKTKMEWVARPTATDNRVWIFAKYDLPAAQAWPAGGAEFALNGQNIGSGNFIPKSRKVTLYFGADPRVNVKTIVDADKQGQSGFINTSKTWTGAWTYLVSNEHERNLVVKVERPAPQIANEQITVTYKDNPKSTYDEQEHMLYWEIEVPGHETKTIQHSVTISSPEKLPLFPVAP